TSTSIRRRSSSDATALCAACVQASRARRPALNTSASRASNARSSRAFWPNGNSGGWPRDLAVCPGGQLVVLSGQPLVYGSEVVFTAEIVVEFRCTPQHHRRSRERTLCPPKRKRSI